VEEAVVDPEIMERKTREALDLLKGLLDRTDSSREVTAAAKGSEIVFTLPGGVPEWMGRGHSPVLDSLQFLLNKSVNRFPPRYRIVVQGQGTQQSEQRQTELETMARELAQQVIATGVPMWVLPMSPRERRFVHMAIRTMDGVDTESVGSGTTRRIRIFATAHPEQ
jgi:spoIIIJ-associated protein